MDRTEQFIVLDETYLPQMAELYKNAFEQEPWNDNWSNEEQLKEYIKEISFLLIRLISGCLLSVSYLLFQLE